MTTGRGFSRRAFLASSASLVGAGAIASGTASAQERAWPTFGRDAGNSRYHPEVELYGDEPAQRWTLNLGDDVTSEVVVSSSAFYFTDSSGRIYRVTEDGDSAVYDQGTDGDAGTVSRTSTPAIEGDRIYVGGLNDRIFAIDPGTGDTEWEFETEGLVRAAPAVVDDQVLVGCTDGTVYGVAAETGEQTWTYRAESPIHATPCVLEGRAFVAAEHGALHGVNLASGDGETVLDLAADLIPSPISDGERVYVATTAGELFAVDSADRSTMWSTDLSSGVTATPAVAENVLYVGTEDGSLVALDSGSGRVRWSTRVDGPVTTGIAATADAILAATDTGAINAVDPDGEEIMWTFDVGAEITTPLSVANDALYFGTTGGSVLAITSERGTVDLVFSEIESHVPVEPSAVRVDQTHALLATGGVGTLVAAGYALSQTWRRGRGADPGSDVDEGTDSQTDDGHRITGGPVLSGDAEPIGKGPDVDTTDSLALGDVAYEDFEKSGQIGSGGNADVYEACVVTDDGEATVALKEPRLSEGETMDASAFSDFLEEAEVWSSIDDHERVVSVYEWGSDPVPWIVMEYMPEGTLNAHLDSLSREEVFVELEGLCEAIHHAHRHGITHTDIKPENILYTEVDGTRFGKMTDWGLANVLLEHSTSVEGFTPSYSAPEQLEPKSHGGTDDQTDIYQLGVVAYEMFTGELPYDTESYGETVNAILNDDPVVPSERNPELDEELDRVLLRALAERKEERYETVLHFRDDLRRAYSA